MAPVTTIVITPSPMEFGLDRDMYDALVADLEAAGFDVRLEAPVERRGAIQHAGGDAVIQLLGDAAAIIAAVVTVTEAVRRHVHARRGRKKHVPFFGPKGERLEEVEIDPEDTD